MEPNERTSTKEESQTQVDEEVEKKTQEDVDLTQQKPSRRPTPNTLGFMQSEQYPWNDNTPRAQYEEYMKTPKVFSNEYARAFYYKVATSKGRKSFSIDVVNVPLKTNERKDPATVPKSVCESPKEHATTTSKSISESMKDLVTTSKSISESLKEPVTTLKSISKSVKDHVTTSKSISEGMKKPVTSSKSIAEGMKDPVTTSKSMSEGMMEPVTTLKSISEGMKNPVTNCLSESTSEFKNAYVAMLNKAIDFLDSYLVCHDVILNFSTPSTLHELVEIFKRKLATFLNILTESMVTNTSQKKENLQLYDSLIRESSLVMREKHLDREKNFHDMKVEFICSFIRLNGAKVLLPEELKALCSIVTQELKGDLKEATNLCSI